ncbi:MAG: hypothetical protein ACPGSG_10980 [Prolixibacteraceae bacterium]
MKNLEKTLIVIAFLSFIASCAMCPGSLIVENVILTMMAIFYLRWSLFRFRKKEWKRSKYNFEMISTHQSLMIGIILFILLIGIGIKMQFLFDRTYILEFGIALGIFVLSDEIYRNNKRVNHALTKPYKRLARWIFVGIITSTITTLTSTHIKMIYRHYPRFVELYKANLRYPYRADIINALEADYYRIHPHTISELTTKHRYEFNSTKVIRSSSLK